ncbi:T9SS type A sorting domain-containing protein [Cesiribacter andamanensis]|uniref:Secretion system C-terminal sorting domain-containing protein n=1 Tax=Cesiribacter andamanensis AMV16 TaxID=1279009 RepID=M7N7E5_9BACT|nr:T9SS type A sorting domain-containing protein [Cesiribacter andamanensis]EMR04533.1 hypothetical protein ADICEAN_00291 [Cesiribacter andamanensis AMV16]
MKKLLLFILLVALGGPVFGQTYTVYYTVSSTNWAGSTSKWATGEYTGDINGLTSSTFGTGTVSGLYPGSTGKASGPDFPEKVDKPDIMLIRAGHTVSFTNIFYYNGIILIEPGATLFLNKLDNEKGRLIMDADSYIIIRPGGDIKAASQTDSGLSADFLEIGGKKINGNAINFMPFPRNDGVFWLNPEYLDCIQKEFNMSGNNSDPTAPNKCDYLAYPPTPQPVDLTHYTVRSTGSSVEVRWEAAKEWNFSHYVVEWSTEGSTFTPAGTISAKGTDYGKQVYSFRHSPGLAGTVYYRLLTVDIDGTVEDKGTRVVRIGAEVFNAHAKNGRVHITYNGPAESQLVLFDTSGRVIKNAGLSTEGFETAGIAPGMYLLQISNSLERKVTRVVLQ